MNEKLEKLRAWFRDVGSCAIAFSGGVDSTFLLKVAHDELGAKCLAVTAQSCSFPKRELDEAAAFCAKEGARHVICHSEELDIPGFRDNPRNRCYLCKHELFTKIVSLAKKEGLAAVCEGSNIDDLGDYRPGLKAVEELGVRSPLRECGFTKQDIRECSRELGLPTWRKQSFACLASRFPYGERIDEEKLSRVDRAEQFLLDIGLRQVRVRSHGDIARIETETGQFPLLLQHRDAILSSLKSFGFKYISLDLQGYRTGSMNE